jgi:hypothetical protein
MEIDEITTFPQTLTDALHSLPKVRVSTDGLYIANCGEDDDDWIPPLNDRTMPTSNIVSFKGSLASNFEISQFHQVNIQALLVATNKLEVLNLSRNSPWSFKSDGGRLPPLKEPALINYLWNHRPEELILVWDFSKLETLVLNHQTKEDIPQNEKLLRYFLHCVTPEQFPRLRNFECTNGLQPDRAKSERTDRLLGHFIENLNRLRELSITGFGSTLVVQHILNIGKKLRVLRMPVGRDPSKDFFRPDQLKKILDSCSELEELHISCGFIEDLVSCASFYMNLSTSRNLWRFWFSPLLTVF